MKNKIIRGILLFMVCVLMMSQTAYAYGIDKSAWNKMTNVKKNERIEEIIDNSKINTKRGSSVVDEGNFLDSSNGTNALEGKTEKEIETYFSTIHMGTADRNKKGGIIDSPVKYLQNTVGKKKDTYTVVESKMISGVTRSTCSSLDSGNNCTLTALYNVMRYYRAEGYSKIPSSNDKLYIKIKTQATKLGYTSENGFPVTKNNNLVKNTWRKGFGYSSGNGSNNYLWTDSTVKSAIKNNRPFLFSMASGAYFDHTIAVYGYKVYKNNRTGKKYTFLVVADGWSSSARYLAFTNTGESYVACMTSVTPPTSKTK